MKNKLALFLFTLLLSCATPQDSLVKKDYETAFKTSLRQLKRKKSYEENKLVLVKSLQKIVMTASQQIDHLKYTNDLNDQIRALSISKQVLSKVNKSSPYTDNQFSDSKDFLNQEINWLNQTLSQKYFEHGLHKLKESEQTQNKALAQNAYFDFLNSQKYGNNEALLDSLLSRSLELGQVVYTIEASTNFNVYHSPDINRRFDDLESFTDQFIKVVYAPIVAADDTDCQIEIEFGSLDLDIDESIRNERFEKEIITSEDTVLVYAEVRFKHLTKTASWQVDIDVNGNQNCNISGHRFEEEFISEIDKIEIDGDDRAVPPQYKCITSEQLMSDSDMVEELLDIIYDRVAYQLF